MSPIKSTLQCYNMKYKSRTSCLKSLGKILFWFLLMFRVLIPNLGVLGLKPQDDSKFKSVFCACKFNQMRSKTFSEVIGSK